MGKMLDWKPPLHGDLLKGRVRIRKNGFLSKGRKYPRSPQRKCKDPGQTQTEKTGGQGKERLLPEGVRFVPVVVKLKFQE